MEVVKSEVCRRLKGKLELAWAGQINATQASTVSLSFKTWSAIMNHGAAFRSRARIGKMGCLPAGNATTGPPNALSEQTLIRHWMQCRAPRERDRSGDTPTTCCRALSSGNCNFHQAQACFVHCFARYGIGTVEGCAERIACIPLIHCRPAATHRIQ
jgi:hypothetical protein